MLQPLQTLAAMTAEHTRLVEVLVPPRQGKLQSSGLTTCLARWAVEQQPQLRRCVAIIDYYNFRPRLLVQET